MNIPKMSGEFFFYITVGAIAGILLLIGLVFGYGAVKFLVNLVILAIVVSVGVYLYGSIIKNRK